MRTPSMKIVLFLPLLIVAACAVPPPSPPPTPAPSDIGIFGNSVVASGLSPADYLNYGLTLASAHCATWFGQQVAGANNSSMLEQLLALGGAAAAVGGGSVGRGIAAGAAMGAGAIGIYQSNQPAGAMPAIVYSVVQRELQAFEANMPVPVTLGDSAALVEAFSEKCQQADISGAIVSAITTAPVSVVQPFSSTFRAFGSPPARVLPPTIVVGTPPSSSGLSAPMEPQYERVPQSSHRLHRRAPSQASAPPSSTDREWAEVQRTGRAAYETALAGGFK